MEPIEPVEETGPRTAIPSAPSASLPPTSPLPPTTPVRAGARGTQDRLFTGLLVVAMFVAVGGVAFAVGRLTAPATAATGTGRNGAFGQGGQFPGGAFPSGALPSGAPGFGRNGFLGGGTAISGTVDSTAGSSLTLKLANGQSVTVNLDGATTYHRQGAASASDLAAGQKVIVQVQVDRAGFGPGGSPGPNPSGAPASSGSPGGFQRAFTATDVTIAAP